LYKFIKSVDCSVIDTSEAAWKIVNGPDVDYATATLDILEIFGLKCEFCRLIKIPAGGFIKRHSDNGGRPTGIRVYHAVIATNDECLNISYVDPVQAIHLPVDTLWEFDTLPEHESYNRGSTDRIHLVIDSYD
jgi:hypothetical protein